MSETDLKRAVTKYLEMSGWLVTRAQAGRVRIGVQLAKTGTADLVCCADGRYVEVEIKLPKGSMRPSQEKRCGAVLARNGRYFVVRSMTDAIAMVKEMQPC